MRDALSAAVVAGCGFALLGITFVLDFLFNNVVDRIGQFFVSPGSDLVVPWFPTAKHVAFLAVIGMISLPILRSRIGEIYKAIFLTVPVAVALVTIGILLYRWQPFPYLVGAVFVFGTLAYLYRTRQSWLYYYAVIVVATSLMIFTLAGGDM